MRKIETYGHIKNGVLHIHYRLRFNEAIKQAEDCGVRVTVEKLFRKRSTMTENGTGQNGYYWHVVIFEFREGYYQMTGEQIGSDEAHEVLKAKFNHREVINEQTGEVLKVPRTTSTLSTVEFEEYLEQCRGFILEWFGRRVPLPNEQTEMEFNNPGE